MPQTRKTEVGRAMPPATAQVAPYVEALGAELAVTFLMTYGGAQLSLADDPKGRASHAALLGYEKAKALAAQPGLQKRVPLAKRWLAAMAGQLYRCHRPPAPRFGRVRAPLVEGVEGMKLSADGGASHPVTRKPRIALRSNDRATAERITPCHACQEGNSR